MKNCELEKGCPGVAKWLALAKQTEKLFPGYVVVAMDPGVTIVLYGKNRFEESIEVDRVNLSEKAIETLERMVGEAVSDNR